MDDSQAIALAFAAMLLAGFATAIALFSSDGAPAFAFFIVAIVCSLDFICRLDFDIVRES